MNTYESMYISFPQKFLIHQYLFKLYTIGFFSSFNVVGFCAEVLQFTIESKSFQVREFYVYTIITVLFFFSNKNMFLDLNKFLKRMWEKNGKFNERKKRQKFLTVMMRCR